MGSIDFIRQAYQIDAPIRHPRKLGERFAPRRQHYILQIPLCLFMASIFSWLIPSEGMMVMACAVGSAAGIYLAYDWLLRRGPLRFSTVYGMGLLLGYCLGSMNTWLTEPRAGLSLSGFMFRDPAVLSRAVASVLLASGILIAIGELYERPVFGEEFRIAPDGRMLAFIYSGTAVIVVGFLTKRITIGGIGLSATGAVSPINALMLGLFFPLVAMAVSVFLSAPPGRKKILLGMTAGLLMVLLMTQGRRNQIYTVFLILFAVRFSGYRMRGNFLKKAIYLGALLAVSVTGLLSYQLLRSLGRFGGYTQIGLMPRLERAAEMIQEGTAFSTAVDTTQKNVQRRTFVLTFYADLLEASSQQSPAYGADIVAQLEEALPRALFPSKVIVEEETLANEQFGMHNTDQPNSLITAGALDFGLLGTIFYPLIMAYVLRRFVEIVSLYLPLLPTLFITLFMVYTAVQTETTGTSYAIAIRNSLLLGIILVVFSVMPQIRLRNRG